MYNEKPHGGVMVVAMMLSAFSGAIVGSLITIGIVYLTK